jgi:hypothetical protein
MLSAFKGEADVVDEVSEVGLLTEKPGVKALRITVAHRLTIASVKSSGINRRPRRCSRHSIQSLPVPSVCAFSQSASWTM